MCSLTANLGDSRTIATHPASTTHSSLSEEERQAVGITPGLVRISVGLEHVSDIIADIAQAMDLVPEVCTTTGSLHLSRSAFGCSSLSTVNKEL